MGVAEFNNHNGVNKYLWADSVQDLLDFVEEKTDQRTDWNHETRKSHARGSKEWNGYTESWEAMKELVMHGWKDGMAGIANRLDEIKAKHAANEVGHALFSVVFLVLLLANNHRTGQGKQGNQCFYLHA